MSKSFFFRKVPKSRDCPWDSSPKQSKEFWLSQSRSIGHKALGLLRLRQKSLGQSRDSELWDSSPWNKNPWDWQSRPMPIPDYSATALELDVLFPRFKPRKTFMEQRDQICESFHFGNTVLLIFRSGSTDVCFRSKLYHFFHRNGYIWDRNVRLCWVVGSQISKLQCCKLLTTFF